MTTSRKVCCTSFPHLATRYLPPIVLIDIGILQYALTLEHLEDAFYTQALAKYSAEDFKKAGFPDYVRKRFVQIGKHEQDHVDYLTAALGVNATKPCSYSL